MSSKLMIAALTIATLALPSPAVLAQEGMTVVRDADSGKLRAPTAAELRALERNLAGPAGHESDHLAFSFR